MSLRRYHAARWDEPLIHQIGAPGRRGQHFPLASHEGLVPAESASACLAPAR
jgi:glycine dehydrogenase subunit 2